MYCFFYHFSFPNPNISTILPISLPTQLHILSLSQKEENKTLKTKKWQPNENETQSTQNRGGRFVLANHS